MRNKSLALLTLWIILSSLSTNAVAGPARVVRGRVISTEGERLPFVTITLLYSTDSVPFVSTTTDTEGRFSLEYPEGKAQIVLQARAIGFNTYRQPLENDTEAPVDITLSPAVYHLAGTEVVAQRAEQKLIPGGIQTTVKGSVLCKLPTMEHLLSSLPMTKIDKDGNVEIIGLGKPEIYLNGKKVRDMVEVSTLSPEEIEHIEVITMPGSEYEGSVRAVVKIKTIGKRGDGLSGILSLTYAHAPSLSHLVAPSVTLNYHRGHWDYLLSSSYVETEINQITEAEVHGKVGEDQWVTTTTHSTLKGKKKKLKHRLGLNYDNGSSQLNLLLDMTNFVPNKQRSLSVQHFESPDLPSSDITTEAVTTLKNRVPTLNPSLLFARKLGEYKLTINADYFSAQDNSLSRMIEREKSGEKTLETGVNTHSILWGTMAKIERTLYGGQWVMGICYNGNTFKNENQADRQLQIPSLSTQLREGRMGVFTSYSRPIAGRHLLSAGIRGEWIMSDYFVNREQKKELSRRYTDIFPSLSFSGAVGGVNTQFALTSSISRPQFFQLRSDYVYLSRFEYQTGTPSLSPSKSVSMSLMLNKGWATAQLYHVFERDRIIQTQIRMEDPNRPGTYIPYRTLFVPLNYPKTLQNTSLVLSLSPKFGMWNPSVNYIVARVWDFDIETTEGTKRSTPFQNLTIRNSFDLPYSITLLSATNILFKGSSFDNIVITKTTQNTSLSLSKTWMEDRLSTSITGDNLMGSVNVHGTLYSKYSTSEMRQRSRPRILFKLSYKFNNTRSKFDRQGAISEDLSRTK